VVCVIGWLFFGGGLVGFGGFLLLGLGRYLGLRWGFCVGCFFIVLVVFFE